MSTPFHIQHALLAMDAYNRGENAALNVPGNRVGDAQFSAQVTNKDWLAAGFFAATYENSNENSRQTHLNTVQELTTGTVSGFGFDRTA
jgi:hypothetical protein